MIRTRFAPSPTGSLHLGGALSALANRRRGDWMLLRIDDTDASREVPGALEAVVEDLAWLGIAWDEGPLRQSSRAERHREAAAGIEGGVHDADGALLFGDRTLLRADGTPTYQLASVVDDLDFDITHVVRGGDHRDNEPFQRSLFAALGADAARVRPPRAAPRAGGPQALEARESGDDHRSAARGRLSGRGGPRLPRRARRTAARRPPRPAQAAAALDRRDRSALGRGARRSDRRTRRARAGPTRRSRPGGGAPDRPRDPRARAGPPRRLPPVRPSSASSSSAPVRTAAWTRTRRRRSSAS